MATPDAGPSTAALAADGLRIVLFGLPAAGKSSLLGALAQAAQAQEHLLNGHLEDPSHGLAELRQRLYDEAPRRTAEEVVPYPLDFEPFNAAGRHVHAVVVDCDGRVANDLLTRRHPLDERSRDGTLAHEVLDADTLVLVVDASAPAAQLEADFLEFDRFLREMEQGRGRRADVAGLPVFLVLTKCDLLARPGDGTLDWMERIEQRKREVDKHFRGFLERRRAEAGSVPFGRIDLHLWATAVKRPALAGTPAKPREPYGVAELFRQCLEQAAAYRRRFRRSSRRLWLLVGGAAGLTAAMLLLVLFFLFKPGEPPPSELQIAVERLQFSDKLTPAERLRGPLPELRRKRDRYQALRGQPGFDALPAAQKEFVVSRLDELNEYVAWVEKMDRARQPAEALSEKALLDTEEEWRQLAPPRADWGDTDAARRRRATLDEAAALQKAVLRTEDTYRERAAQGTRLWTLADYQGGADSPGINWRAWHAALDKLRDATKAPPFDPAEKVPGSATLTYAAVLRFKNVEDARADWEGRDGKGGVKAQLERLRDVSAALGLIGPVADRPPVLVVEKPPGFKLASARPRLDELRKHYPQYRTEFVRAGLPEAMLKDLDQAAGTTYDFLLEPARAAVLDQLRDAGSGGEETAARWAAVREWLSRDPEELAAWRVLAVLLARLRDPDAPDPVTALASFLQKTSFPIEIRRITLEIPDDLKARASESAKLLIFAPAAVKEGPALTFEQPREGKHDAQRRLTVYNFDLAKGTRLVYHPGDELWARLPLRDDLVLSWALNHSARYQFERLSRPPRLHKADELSTSGVLAEGVRLTVTPPDGVPRVPDLMPVVRLAR